ncbi:potassium-transporting ATPase subunit KdpA [Leucobacter sp. UCMA 4100]|uniref:potassium-transporting ATPase subunit KdpA n=1 Tax=Leucobacter sp. UCMA 4100 TaxID=2810534 RepID=UPI0022EACD46|nr:potassium-transporting ATPase subunit KdpA [Leucobacter sp. UCMA 4100]MDA3146880.1 potassium-transporting ATPase subunit KdpA [Leucobacter sp. UCMA 4100]
MFWVYALLSLATVALVLVLAFRPFGDYMAWAYTSKRDWKVERAFYRVIGVAPESQQSWQAYLRGVLSFSAVGLLLVYALQRMQPLLPYALGLDAPSEQLAFNTAASFVGNTNWQSYAPESTLGYTVQFAGLAVQNFVSAAVGMAVAIALVRGFALKRSGTIGNFWVDLTRGVVRILLPLATLAAIALMIGGVVQNFAGFTQVTTLTGATQEIPGGPVASQEAIKLLGTNGGGFFNANSAHSFENPSAFTNLLQVLLMLIIPFSLPRTFGRMVGDTRQGAAIVSVMALLYLASWAALTALEHAGMGQAPELAGAALEGKEQRLGIIGSTLFSTTSTGTSTGAVAAMHDSYTALGGILPMLNMMLGEVSPGGVGSGLYAILVLAVIAVFISGLLIGRTPEYLGKKIGPREMKLAALYILVMPTLVLTGTALSFAIPGVRDGVTEGSIANPGIHGMSEVLYAFTSAANNNGSAFAGLGADTPWFTVALGVVILLGRFVPIVLVLALAGSLAEQDRVPAGVGTLPTHRPMFVGLLTAVTVLVSALTFFPVLALGPLAEGLM